MSQRRAHGPAIRAIREALGISVNKCAVDVGVSVPYLSRLERGERNPTDAVVTALANRLGVSVDAITVPSNEIVINITRQVESNTGAA